MRPVATQSRFTTPWLGNVFWPIRLLRPFGSDVQLFQTFGSGNQLFQPFGSGNQLFQPFGSAISISSLFQASETDWIDRKSSLSVLTPTMRGRFRWSSVFKILEPISLPPTDTLRPREKSMKARRKMGALSQYPTAAVAVLSIIGCGLWWANLPPFQLTDDAVIGAGYSLPNASVMASYRRGRRNGCSSRRGYLIGLGHNADISVATGVPCHRPNIIERAPNRIVSTIIIGKYFQCSPSCLCLSKNFCSASTCRAEWKTTFLASLTV